MPFDKNVAVHSRVTVCSMQISSGLRSTLAVPWAYRLAMRLLGNRANKRWFINHVLALRAGEKVIDVGCGPADILGELPTVEYVGVDISESYIESARYRHGQRGVFICGRVEDWARDPRSQGADLVLANGVLHHVDDDEAKKILEFAYRVLKSNGRFIFYEPCYLLWQSRLSAFMMSKDRGQNIRTEQQWKDLAGSVFPSFFTNILTGVNRLGYVCIIGQCRKTNASAGEDKIRA
jgi:SAM-dependent methyltransferase